jgi:hypothetical protein
MNQATRNILGYAEEAVGRLIQECRPNGPLYRKDPQAVAQLSRTGKWLLSALANLHRRLEQAQPQARQA